MIRQSTINLVGGLLPAVASLTCIPIILQQHGSEFFGIYSIQTALLMVVGLMDLGLSRGIMLVTYDEVLNPSGTPNKPFKSGMQLTRLVALLIFSITLFVLAIIDFLHPTTSDIRLSTLLSAISGGLTILTLPLRALLEIQGKFGSLNVIRTVLACSIPLAPLLPGLVAEQALTTSAIYVLVLRFAGLWAYRRVCDFDALNLERVLKPTPEWKREFIKRCSWVGLTNIGSLILTYADRILLASFASAAALASFVVAHELATKIWMITGAILSATMPRVAADLMNLKTEKIRGIPTSLAQVRFLIIVAIVLPSVILTIFLKPVLVIWLGASYAVDVEIAGKILIAGVALNSMSQLNFGLLQLHKGESHGAKLQLFNIILAAALMGILIPIYGVIGAASAFSLRLIIDAFVGRALLERLIDSKEGFLYIDLIVVLLIFSTLLCVGFMII